MSTATKKVCDLTAPTTATIKRLFALSGNKCAFPKCPVAIISGEKLIGEVCHVKAAKPGGPRYDPNQKPGERHAYENLILLCPNHHAVIDADEEAYTVQRLLKMKSDHEGRTTSMPEELVNKATTLLINNPITTQNQSGGITAQTVNIHYNQPVASDPVPAPPPKGFPAAKPLNGDARFRPPDQPVGLRWNPPLPHMGSLDREIFLSDGAAMWLRVTPQAAPERTWSPTELRNAQRPNVLLQPPICSDLGNLRAEDGYGTYSLFGPRESETNSVAFAFETGEIWGIDTYLLNLNQPQYPIDFLEIVRVFMKTLHNFSRFLCTLGNDPPFNWMAGLEDVKGRRLRLPGNPFPSDSCVSNKISASGAYDTKQSPSVALKSFFDQILRKCGSECPEFLRQYIEKAVP